MILRLIFIFSVTILSFSSFANNIRVINLDLVINQNVSFQKLVKEVENDQKNHKEYFNNIENNLSIKLDEIDELKLILNSNELDKEIQKYNSQLNEFNKMINNFNLYYDNQLNNMRNIILDKVLELIQEYSLENKIDLIIDSKSYIMASNSINITDIILNKLNKIKFETNFKKFEQ